MELEMNGLKVTDKGVPVTEDELRKELELHGEAHRAAARKVEGEVAAVGYQNLHAREVVSFHETAEGKQQRLLTAEAKLDAIRRILGPE